MRPDRIAHLGRRFGREVGEEHGIDAGQLRFLRESLGAVSQHRIDVGKRDQRNLTPAAYSLRDGEDVHNARPRRQRALRCGLNHRAVGNWIGKRYTQFDDAGSSVNRCQDYFARGGEVGIAAGNVGDQRRTMLKEK